MENDMKMVDIPRNLVDRINELPLDPFSCELWRLRCMAESYRGPLRTFLAGAHAARVAMALHRQMEDNALAHINLTEH